MNHSKEIDFLFDNAGDFNFDSESKDFTSTKNKHMRSFIQRLITRIMSSPGDWTYQPNIGAGLNSFAGKPNTRETGERIKETILGAIIGPDMLSPGQATCDVFPLSMNSLAIVLKVQAGFSNNILLTFTYDMRDNKLVPRNT